MLVGFLCLLALGCAGLAYRKWFDACYYQSLADGRRNQLTERESELKKCRLEVNVGNDIIRDIRAERDAANSEATRAQEANTRTNEAYSELERAKNDLHEKLKAERLDRNSLATAVNDLTARLSTANVELNAASNLVNELSDRNVNQRAVIARFTEAERKKHAKKPPAKKKGGRRVKKA